MKRHMVIALVALNILCIFATPLNNVAVEESDSQASAVVAENLKGNPEELLKNYQSDGDLVRVCDANSCTVSSVGAVKAMPYDSITNLMAVKGDPMLTKALTPSVDTVLASVKGLSAQQQRLEKLQAEMDALNAMFDKGAASSTKASTQYAAMMTKGIVLPAAPPKAYAAALPPSKGSVAAAAGSKGSLQLEAAMCPMTMYELGKAQKLNAEVTSQLQTCNLKTAMLMREKAECEAGKAAAEMGKLAAEQQAAMNAKIAAEQKARADRLEILLAQANQENAALKNQKAILEETLSVTQDALTTEREKSAALTVALGQCNDDKAQLEAEKAVLISTLADTREQLAETQRALEKEKIEHQKTQRELEATIAERDAIEAARKQLEEAKQQLEDELAETKSQLEAMTVERDQLQIALDATNARLEQCTADKIQCEADLSNEKALTALLTGQLADAMALLAEEKKAREELTALLLQVKATAEALQEEVRKLQLENALLRDQLMKLKTEQEMALAMAAGCPSSYEKFGTSCYKYVREKTQWKMAQEQCMKDGGNLVAVETRLEQTFLVNYLKRQEARFDDKYLHLGGFDYHVNGVFKWISNQSPVDLGETFWLSNNPRGMGRRCLAFQTWDMDYFGQWADEYCWVSLPFVCEMPAIQ